MTIRVLLVSAAAAFGVGYATLTYAAAKTWCCTYGGLVQTGTGTCDLTATFSSNVGCGQTLVVSAVGGTGTCSYTLTAQRKCNEGEEYPDPPTPPED